MTEADTFLVLSRTPFDQVHKVVLNMPPAVRNKIWMTEADTNKFLEPYNWTHDEWMVEYNRLTKLGLDYRV